VQNNKVSLKSFIIPSIPLAIIMVGGCFVLWISYYVGGQIATVPLLQNQKIEIMQSLILPNSLLSSLIAFWLTLLNAFLLTQLSNRFTLIRSRTFLPIFIFLLLMSTWNETHIVSGSQPALTLFIIALFFILSMFHDLKASEEAFMGSLLISISSLLINPLIFIIPVFWIGFAILRCFSLRTFLASILGTLVPLILYVAGHYLLNPDTDYLKLFNLDVSFNFDLYSYSLPDLIYLGSLVIIMMICLAGMFSIYSRDAIHSRKKLNLLLLLLISFSVLSIVYENQFASFLPFIALLNSFLASHPFTLKQNDFYGILFIIFCALNIAYIISKYIVF